MPQFQSMIMEASYSNQVASDKYFCLSLLDKLYRADSQYIYSSGRYKIYSVAQWQLRTKSKFICLVWKTVVSWILPHTDSHHLFHYSWVSCLASFLPLPHAEPFLLCSSGMFLLLIFMWHPPPFLYFPQPSICFAVEYHRLRLVEILVILLASFLSGSQYLA